MPIIARKIMILIFLFTLNSCFDDNSDKNTKVSNSENNVGKNYSSLTSSYENQRQIVTKKAWKAIETGDSMLYQQASIGFKLSNNPKELVFFSIIMAMKYDNALAYSDISYIYGDLYKYGLSDNEKYLKSFLLYCSAKSKEKGHKFKGMNIGDSIIDSRHIKSSNYYLDEMKIYKSSKP